MLPEDVLCGSEFIDEEEPELGDQKEHSVLLRDLHVDWEVIGKLGVIHDFSLFLELLNSCWWGTDLNDVHLGWFALLLLNETEQFRPVHVVVH